MQFRFRRGVQLKENVGRSVGRISMDRWVGDRWLHCSFGELFLFDIHVIVNDQMQISNTRPTKLILMR